MIKHFMDLQTSVLSPHGIESIYIESILMKLRLYIDMYRERLIITTFKEKIIILTAKTLLSNFIRDAFYCKIFNFR